MTATSPLDDAIVSALNDIGRSSTLLELSAVIASKCDAGSNQIVQCTTWPACPWRHRPRIDRQ